MLNKKEKLLKILIFIGIAAILVSLFIKYIWPSLDELFKQRSDKIRIENLILIDANLNKLTDTNPDISLGKPNKVYISLPSDKTNCEGLSLPTLPKNWEYYCKPKSDYKKADGNGWIPVDFTKLGDDPIKELPIDPVNKADALNYYAFVTGSTERPTWALTTMTETERYLKEKAITDGGTDLIRFEIGSNLQLWTNVNDFLLNGYWQFDEENGTTTTDSSGNNNTCALIGEPDRVDGKIGKALFFDGVDDYVYCGNDETLNITGDITIEAWVKPNKNHAFPIVSKNTYHQDYEFTYRINVDVLEKLNVDVLEFNYRTPNLYTPRIVPNIPLKTDSWSHLAVSVNCDTKIVGFYINGKATENQSVTECPNNYYHKPLFIGSRNGLESFFNGIMDEVKIYNRALSATEIQAMYNATK